MISKQREIVDSEWSVDALHIYEIKTASSYSVAASISLLVLVWPGQVSIAIWQQQFHILSDFALHSGIVVEILVLGSCTQSWQGSLTQLQSFPGLGAGRLVFLQPAPGYFIHLQKQAFPHPHPCVGLYFIGECNLEVLKKLIVPDGSGIRGQTSFWLERGRFMSR